MTPSLTTVLRVTVAFPTFLVSVGLAAVGPAAHHALAGRPLAGWRALWGRDFPSCPWHTECLGTVLVLNTLLGKE